MPTTSPKVPDLASCPHDRGPGITVCLRCRAESHRRAAASRRRIAMQAGLAIVTIAVAIAGGNNILAARTRSAAVAPAGAVVQSGRSNAGPSESFSVTRADAREPGAAVVAARAMLAPVVAAGRTDLLEGRFAERSADSLTVHFDTPLSRTRRRDKFEQIVRGTLPSVYGAAADSMLAAVPAGTFADNGDLLTELPERGVQLPAHGGWTLTVWPGLRPGQDGPLVVSYRVTAARGQ